MLTLNDGRTELWQWDTNRNLTVDAECSQVHFSNKVFGRSIDVDVFGGVAIIPDILLQTDKELTAWAFVGTPENGYTKISKVFKVNRRNKPADYVFTPTDQTTLGELVERLSKIEESQDPDAIKNAVDDYLDNNPIQIEETDPTVPEWAKQPEKPNYTAAEVGALPADTVIPEIPAIPSKLPNPHPLTFTGAVEATYDGSAPLTVNIPEGGGGTGGGSGGNDDLKLLTEMTIAEDGVTQLLWEKTDTGEDFVWNELYVLIKAVKRSGSLSSLRIGKPSYKNNGELFIDNSTTLIQTNSFGNTSRDTHYYFETVPVGSRRKTTMVESNGDFFNTKTIAVTTNTYSDGTALMSPPDCKDMTAVFAYIPNGIMTGDYIEIWYR